MDDLHRHHFVAGMTADQFYRFALTDPCVATVSLRQFSPAAAHMLAVNVFMQTMWYSCGSRRPSWLQKRRHVRFLSKALGPALRPYIKILVDSFSDPNRLLLFDSPHLIIPLMVYAAACLCTEASPDDETFNRFIDRLLENTRHELLT